MLEHDVQPITISCDALEIGGPPRCAELGPFRTHVRVTGPESSRYAWRWVDRRTRVQASAPGRRHATRTSGDPAQRGSWPRLRRCVPEGRPISGRCTTRLFTSVPNLAHGDVQAQWSGWAKNLAWTARSFKNAWKTTYEGPR